MSVPQIFESLVDRLHSAASVRAVYGEPIVAQGKTIVPVARVAYGFDGGFGADAADHPGGRADQGAGGGGGVAVIPVGVVEIQPDGTRFVPIAGPRRLVGALLLGLGLGLLVARRR